MCINKQRNYRLFMNTKEQLEKIGLHEKEAAVYATLLERKNCSVTELARASHLPKSTVADVLHRLSKQGIVKTYKQKLRKRYAPVDPEIFKRLAENRLASVAASLPKLQALFGSAADRPVVHFYEGEYGLQKVLDDILREADEQYGIVSPDRLFPSLPEYFPRFSDERVKRGIFSHLIFTNSAFARERHQTDDAMLRESKVIDDAFGLDAMILMWQQKVAIITYGKTLSVLVVESESIRTTFQQLFNMIWKYVPKVTP